jgi:hypothetical protein
MPPTSYVANSGCRDPTPCNPLTQEEREPRWGPSPDDLFKTYRRCPRSAAAARMPDKPIL